MVSASENAFKGIFTSLPKPGGGEFGKFYSLPALNDPRVGKHSYLLRSPIFLEHSRPCSSNNPKVASSLHKHISD